MGKLNLKSRKRKEQTIAIVIIAAVVLIVTAAILLFAASNNSELGEHDHDNDYDSQATELTLKVAVDAHVDEVHYNAAVKFEEQVESRTGGAVQVELYAKGKLGENKALIKALEENEDVVDIVIAPVSDFVEVEPKMDMSTLPFMFESKDAAWDFMNGEIQSEIESTLLNKNIQILTYYDGEMTCIVSADKVINNVTDIMNMTLAEGEKTKVSNVLQMMNARTVVLDEQAAYQAINQNQCDGYLGSLTDIYENHLYQQQTYLAVTNHKYEGLAFAISSDKWAKLGEYQEVVQEIAKSSAYTDKDLMEQQERTMLERIKATGVRILYPDMSSFAEKAESYLKGQSSKYGTLIEKHIIEQKMNQ